jgi:hypothetical protein
MRCTFIRISGIPREYRARFATTGGVQVGLAASPERRRETRAASKRSERVDLRGSGGRALSAAFGLRVPDLVSYVHFASGSGLGAGDIAPRPSFRR